MLERDLGRLVRGAVDDDHLPDDTGSVEALAAPVDEVADRDRLVERRDDDGQLGLDDVVSRHEETNLGIDTDVAQRNGLGGPGLAGGHAAAHVSGSHRRPR